MDFVRKIILQVEERRAERALRKVERRADKINDEFRKTERQLNRNQRATNRWRDSVRGLGAGFTVARGALVGLTGLITGGAFIAGLTDTAERLDRIAKSSKELRVDPNFLRSLNTFASFQGVDENAIRESLRFLNREFGKFQTGRSKALEPAIGTLGIEEALRNAENLTQRFSIVLDAIRTQEKSVQSGLLADFFGARNGGQLTLLFEGDDSQLQATLDRARRAVGEFSQESFANAEQLQDSIEELTVSFTSLKDVVFSSPGSTTFLDGLSGELQSIRDQIIGAGGVLQALRENFREGFVGIGEALTGNSIPNSTFSRDQVNTVIRPSRANIQNLSSQLPTASRRANDAAARTAEARRNLDLARSVGLDDESQQIFVDTLKKREQAEQELVNAVSEITRRLRQEATKIVGLTPNGGAAPAPVESLGGL